MAGTEGRLNIPASVESVDEGGVPTRYLADGVVGNAFANGLPLILDESTTQTLVAAVSSGLITLAQVSVQIGEDYYPLTFTP